MSNPLELTFDEVKQLVGEQHLEIFGLRRLLGAAQLRIAELEAEATAGEAGAPVSIETRRGKAKDPPAAG